MSKAKDSFMEFLKLCDQDPEKALYEAAKSVVGNNAKDSPIQIKGDEPYIKWAGPHGLHNLRVAIEYYMRKKGLK